MLRPDTVELADVLPGSAADDAGLRAGDRVVEVAGRAVSSSDDIVAACRAQGDRPSVPMRIEREGHEADVELHAASWVGRVSVKSPAEPAVSQLQTGDDETDADGDARSRWIVFAIVLALVAIGTITFVMLTGPLFDSEGGSDAYAAGTSAGIDYRQAMSVQDFQSVKAISPPATTCQALYTAALLETAGNALGHQDAWISGCIAALS